MAKYRKKPIAIEAIQLPDPDDEAGKEKFHDWVIEHQFNDWTSGDDGIYINTLEGVMHCPAGHWVIKGIKGEFYAIDPVIFAESYEIVDA